MSLSLLQSIAVGAGDAFLSPTANRWAIAAAVIATVITTAVYFTVYNHYSKDAPPYVNVLFKALTFQFDFKHEGPLSVIWHAYHTAGDAFRLQLAHQPVTVLIGPAATQAFFDANDDQLSQREVYQFVTPVFGKGLVYDASLNVLQQQLKFLSHGLSSTSIATYAERVVSECVDYFNDRSRFSNHGGELDLYHAISELTINTASSTLLGDEIRRGMQSEFALHYHHLSMGMTPISFFAPRLPIAAHRKRDHARREIVKLFAPIIQQRRAQNYQPKAPATPQDFLQDLIFARYSDKRALTDDEIVGMLVAALFAGQHTSNITATWMILALVHNNMTAAVLAEQAAVQAKHGANTLTYAIVDAEMPFLDCALMEVLRLFPPLIFLMRQVKQPLTVTTTAGKSYVVPVGDIVAVSPAVSGRLPAVWGADALEFKPSRFAPDSPYQQLQQRAKAEKRRDYSWMGFGGGRHECLGRRFAYMQIKTVVAVMFREFDMKLKTTTAAATATATSGEAVFPARDFDAMVVGPVAPTIITYKRRNAAVVA